VLKEFQKDIQTVRQEVTVAKSEVKEIKVKMSELDKSVAFSFGPSRGKRKLL
jgi:hypothetical protein